jgi:Family of unknown function (DUF5995)
MSASAPPTPSLLLHRLEQPETIDDVIRTIDDIIGWAIKAESPIGYFAVLYRRCTLAIREAINENVFDDGHRMEELDVAFGRRYFDALNAYFHPAERQGLTLPWAVAFVGDQDRQAIILQHMLAGLNAHITFDLGLALLATAADSLDTLTDDYNRVNVILCAQIPGIVKVVQQLSPELHVSGWLIPGEIDVLKEALTKLRRGAWLFAIYMAMHPQNAWPKRLNQEAWTAALSSWYLQPSEKWTGLPRLIRAIAQHESRDVAGNIRALDVITRTPEKLDTPHL